MSASIGSHILRQDDDAWAATWAPFTLKSAFQPIFQFEKGKLSVVAFEALLRPFRDGKPTSPIAFLGELPTAERILVENLSHTMHLLNAAAYLPGNAEIFINFDPSIFIDHAVAVTAIREMRTTLSKISVAPHRVVCELTERETVSEEILFGLVESLKASGFRIAIDDFGAEESDMGRVRDLRPDIVKFDGGWVSRLMVSGPGLALLSTMVSTFNEQGIRTLFEGIEEGWQIELAEKTGVLLVQGFALARPEIVPASFVAPKQEGAPESHPRHLPSFRPRASDPCRRRTAPPEVFRAQDVLTMNAEAELRAWLDGAIVVDEIGIEGGGYGIYRLRCLYEQIFERRRQTLKAVAIAGQVAPYLGVEEVPINVFREAVAEEDAGFIELMSLALMVRNHANTGVDTQMLVVGLNDRHVRFVADEASEAELEPAAVVCALDEAAVATSRLSGVAAEIRDRGMRVAIGDFGVSRWTDEQMNLLAPDIVIIDGDWFRKICRDPVTVRLFDTVVARLHERKARVLVGGIENEQHLSIAIRAGADLFKGTHLAPRALAGSELVETLPLRDKLGGSEKIVPLYG